MSKRAISVKTIREKRFHLLNFEGEWAEKMGNPEQNFRALFYGPSGSGKTVEVLRFADYLASNYGKVLYNSWEEGISKSIQDSIIEFDIRSTKLFFFDGLQYDELCEKAKRGRYRFVIIDSLQYMGFTYAQYQDFTRRFKTKGLILISQVNGKGKSRGGEQIVHAVDMKVSINAGKANYRSRFRKGGHYNVDLFKQPKPQLELNLADDGN